MKQSNELEVERLLAEIDKTKKWGRFENWPLKEVPFHVLYANFSRAGRTDKMQAFFQSL